jgi:hypothetical protein
MGCPYSERDKAASRKRRKTSNSKPTHNYEHRTYSGNAWCRVCGKDWPVKVKLYLGEIHGKDCRVQCPFCETVFNTADVLDIYEPPIQLEGEFNVCHVERRRAGKVGR